MLHGRKNKQINRKVYENIIIITNESLNLYILIKIIIIMFLSFDLKKDYEFLKNFLKNRISYKSNIIFQLVTYDKNDNFVFLRGHLKENILQVDKIIFLTLLEWFIPISGTSLKLESLPNIIKFIDSFKESPINCMEDYNFISRDEYWRKRKENLVIVLTKDTDWLKADFSIWDFSNKEFIRSLKLLYSSYHNSINKEINTYSSSKMTGSDAKPVMKLLNKGMAVSSKINSVVSLEEDTLSSDDKKLIDETDEKFGNIMNEVAEILYNTTKVKSIKEQAEGFIIIR